MKELRNAETIRKNKREKNRKGAAFIRNPYKFASSVLEGKRSWNSIILERKWKIT